MDANRHGRMRRVQIGRARANLVADGLMDEEEEEKAA